MNRVREGNVDVSPEVDMADLGFVKAELAAAEAMRCDGDLRPGCNFFFKEFGLRGHLSGWITEWMMRIQEVPRLQILLTAVTKMPRAAFARNDRDIRG